MNRPVSAAVSAAGAAIWVWSADTETLTIEAPAGGSLSHLDGVWRLPAFLEQVEGLSRAALSAQLRNGAMGEPRDIKVVLTDSRPVRFLGAVTEAGAARGLILSPDIGPLAPLRSDVEPVFQPIRRIQGLEVVGFEALARFRDPVMGLVGADAVASVGEEIDWTAIAPTMLARSAEVLSRLRASGHDVFMQVNLSAADISQPELVATIIESIRRARLPFGVLRMELTEQAALRDAEAAVGALSAIRGAGAGLVLDDFGAGHSSFAWLAELPADGVKFDPKLVRMAGHPRADVILGALTRLVHELGMTVTAEGVESSDRAAPLSAIGCDFVQGFAYDYPLQADDLAAVFGKKL